jgi:hypothetical protein
MGCPRFLSPFGALFAAVVFVGLAHAGGVGISVPPDVVLSDSLQSIQVVDTLFYPYRPRPSGSLWYRDLEFQWSRRYSLARGDEGLSADEEKTLDHLGKTLCDPSRARNPFNAPYSDINLVYDYFNGKQLAVPFYRPSPYDTTGLLVGGTTDDLGVIPEADRRHVDAYLYEPGQHDEGYGSYPSGFTTAKEDSSTSGCESVGCVRPKNSLMFPGPPRSGYLDLTGTGWTAPDSTVNWGFIHEFEHAVSADGGGCGGSGDAVAEIFTTGAEELSGSRWERPVFDVPYTWSLLMARPRGDVHEPGGARHLLPDLPALRRLPAVQLPRHGHHRRAPSRPAGRLLR